MSSIIAELRAEITRLCEENERLTWLYDRALGDVVKESKAHAETHEALAVYKRNCEEVSADWLDAEFTITGLREKLAAAEHEIAVLNRMVCFETCVSLNCLESDLHCGSPECIALLHAEAERQLKEEEHA